jgi:hypothetical protein
MLFIMQINQNIMDLIDKQSNNLLDHSKVLSKSHNLIVNQRFCLKNSYKNLFFSHTEQIRLVYLTKNRKIKYLLKIMHQISF